MNFFNSRRQSVQCRPVSMMESLEDRRLFAASAAAPFVDDAGVLQITGTNKSDTIVVTVDATAGTLSVNINGVINDFPAFATGQVSINGGNGDDQISVIEMSEATLISFSISGGNGKDMLLGASAADTLDGGNGKDLLDGAGGDDILIGGHSKDTLIGSDGKNHFVNDRLDKLGDANEDDTVDVVDMVKPKGGPKK